MRRSLTLALATLVILTGCNVQRANDSFRTGYRRSFLQQCTKSLNGSPAERVSGSYCTCVADELLKRFSSADLAAFSLHVAPKRVTDEATVVARRCAKIAIGRLPRDSGSNACNAPAIVTYPAQPGLPTSAPPAKRRVVVEVEVTIETNGLVRNAQVHNSSGRADIDKAALIAATHSTYWPKFVNCHPVESRYLFKAVFDPNRE